LGAYSPTTTNDTKYLKLDSTKSISTNVGITVSGTGEVSGDGSLISTLEHDMMTKNSLTYSSPLSKSVVTYFFPSCI